MKFDTDLVLESFEPLKELEKMNKHAMNIRITKKLEQVVDLLRHTEKGQEDDIALTTKQKDFKFVTDLQLSYNNGTRLTETDMLTCNVIWKRYN